MKRTPVAVNNFKSITIKGTGRVHLGNRIILEDEEESKTKGVLAAADWLPSANHYQRRIDLLAKRHGRTGEWFLHTPEFHKWVNDEGQTLWCHGIAGSGKSVIASLIADRLIQYKQDSATYVAFIFAGTDTDHRNTAEDVLTSLLKQFLIETELSTYCSHLENMYTAHRLRKTRPSWEEYLDVFRLSMDKASKVFIVIDGLDQLGIDNESMTRLLNTLEGWPHLNLLITARSKTPFTDSKRPRAYVNISASSQDMKSYLEYRTTMVPGFQNLLARDASLQSALVDIIVEKSCGMFLMAKLHFDLIATKHCARDIQAALHAYPEFINYIYRKSWHKIHEQDQDTIVLATRVLDMVCYTSKPLTMAELQHALSWRGVDGDCHDDMMNENFLISVCHGLIFLAPDGTVRLIHPTARHFYHALRVYNARAAGLRLRLFLLWWLNCVITAANFDYFGYCPSLDILKNYVAVSATTPLLRRKGRLSRAWIDSGPTGLKHALAPLFCILVILYLVL
ncbi:uncharacterized protein LDX57_000280 [Aspergillus melleus]|uniref:uncharacterized protein n=1 Tax=Aspergillus melleus TaxID=138277 RepID=UPI001E8DE38C|nr:uncharacterized protein LDX57_000280 [Aspergillus melleus]KAH8422526.1 hypothetical protein LDX57_000280 [Aspergillus melleus]